MSDKLVVYCSRADENYVSGQLKQLEVGNTEAAARIILRLTGADAFKIEQEKPYSKSYNTCIAEAQEDQRRDARPALKAYPDSLDAYRVIYLGYPNYWSTMPMAVFTFLEHFDFAGKVIRPFCTHEGSGLGSSVRDVKRLCPGATVEGGLTIHGTSAGQSENEIRKWLKQEKQEEAK